MQLAHLITAVGLALSHVQAIPVVTPDDSNLIQRVVTLITQPELAVKSIPGFESLPKDPSLAAIMHDHQFHSGITQTLTTLRDMDNYYAPRLYQSILGYHYYNHPGLRSIYRNSLYSRLMDLPVTYPETWRAHLAQAEIELHQQLEIALAHLKLSPMGSDQTLKKLEEFVTHFQREHHDELQKVSNSLLKNLPSADQFGKLEYLTEDQVNAKLAAININAMPVDGKFLSHPHGHPASHTHPTSPAVAPPAAQPISAAA